MEAFSKVKLEAEKVMEANEEVEIFADESELEVTAKADINAEVKRTTEDCEQKLEEVEDVVQKVLWQSFGCSELALALEAAEKDCKRLTGRKSDLRLEVYELMLNNRLGGSQMRSDLTSSSASGMWRAHCWS